MKLDHYESYLTFLVQKVNGIIFTNNVPVWQKRFCVLTQMGLIMFYKCYSLQGKKNRLEQSLA